MSPAKKKKKKAVKRKPVKKKVAKKVTRRTLPHKPPISSEDESAAIAEEQKIIADPTAELIGRISILEGEKETLEQGNLDKTKEIKLKEEEIERYRLAQPPKLSPRRLKFAVESVLFSLLLDAKAEMLASQSLSATMILAQIGKIELNMDEITLTETVVIQKAKALSSRFIQGLEIPKEDMEDFFKIVQQLSVVR